MPVEILMPELGESVHEGTVSRWLKKEGDSVKEDEPVVEIMTDKVNTELPSPATGVLSKILIPEGGSVEVFHAMGIIDQPGEVSTPIAEPSAPRVEEPPTKPQAEPQATSPAVTAPAAAVDGRRWYTPLVRAIARREGLAEAELAAIAGSGTRARVTKRDIEQFLERRGTSAPSKSETVRPSSAPVSVSSSTALTGMRKMIAEAMVRSASVPTVSTLAEVDVTAMVQFRELNKESFAQQHGVKLTYTPFFIKALSEALLEFPGVNSSLQGDSLMHSDAVHMGVAVALGAKGDEGLIVPVIRDSQAKSLIELARELESIAAKARSNQLQVSDVQGGTFTLTNPGSYGAILGTPMINAPQGAIIGTYAIKKMPVIVNDMIAIRSMMNLVLTYDHRIIDGLMAGRFLQAVKARLERFDFFK